MNKLFIALCMLVTSCNAADKEQKVSIVSCYSSMTSKKGKHEILLSDGTFITLQSSFLDHNDVKVTICKKKLPIFKK